MIIIIPVVIVLTVIQDVEFTSRTTICSREKFLFEPHLFKASGRVNRLGHGKEDNSGLRKDPTASHSGQPLIVFILSRTGGS